MQSLFDKKLKELLDDRKNLSHDLKNRELEIDQLKSEMKEEMEVKIAE